jgi:membrane protease YdiL (CAAX protease family)
MTGSAKPKGLGVLVYVTLAAAVVLWYVMFVVRPFNFWIMMTCSTSFLAVVALCASRGLFTRENVTVGNVVLGIVAAVTLYGVFRLGDEATRIFVPFWPALATHRADGLAAIYGNQGNISPIAIGLLLLFPIGFGEEVYWRGYIQRRFSGRWGPKCAFAITTLVYTAVHVPTGNMMLVLAALTCGLFWGALYWRTGSIVPGLVSHMVWDPLVLVVFPIA